MTLKLNICGKFILKSRSGGTFRSRDDEMLSAKGAEQSPFFRAQFERWP